MTAKVFHAELWGKPEEKYARLLERSVADTEEIDAAIPEWPMK